MDTKYRHLCNAQTCVRVVIFVATLEKYVEVVSGSEERQMSLIGEQISQSPAAVPVLLHLFHNVPTAQELLLTSKSVCQWLVSQKLFY